MQSDNVGMKMEVADVHASRWGAVFAMSLCVFMLIASEFLPVSLLTPIATDLQITEGHAGQSISVSGIFAVLTSLILSALMGRADRRYILLSFTLLMLVSGVIISFAPDATVLMTGRALLGIAIGGFWSISAATVMRLVPEASVPKALAILNGGNALATIIAAPLGSFAGAYIGWRWTFFCLVPLAALAFIWQWASLPSMTLNEHPRSKNVLKLLLRPKVSTGMLATSLLFMGQFSLFTYLRPFLESATLVNASTLSALLLVIGLAGFAGTVLIGFLLKKRLYSILVFIPLLMSAIAVALIAYGNSLYMTAILLAAWGLLGTAAPVGWWTWLSKTLPQDAEAGGGLMVAIIQLAITLGAACGGILYDMGGYGRTFTVSAAILVAAAIAAFIAGRIEEASDGNVSYPDNIVLKQGGGS